MAMSAANRTVRWFLGACVLVLAYSSGALANSTPDVLHDFNLKDGAEPLAGLVWDKGELYGTTSRGGTTGCFSGGCGVVFKLTPPASGKTAWTETVLHKFPDQSDGHFPNSALVVGKSGVLYGTTASGGDSAECPAYSADLDRYQYAGCGVVFSLTPPAVGKTAWTYTIIHRFTGLSDGAYPSGGLIIDKSGALYGTTYGGGSTVCPADPFITGATKGCGVAFKLTPPVAGKTAWTETVLHDFASAKEMYRPNGVIMDDTGALYGVANTDVKGVMGVVYKLTPPVAGQASWTSTVLYKFARKGDDVAGLGGVVMDKSGALYGSAYDETEERTQPVTSIIFRLQPPAAGKTAWTETVIHTFAGKNLAYDVLGLVFDKNGALYGTGANFGIVFKLTPTSSKTAWTETILLQGGGPVILGSAGALLGVSAEGGSPNCYWVGNAYDNGSCGFIFKLAP